MGKHTGCELANACIAETEKIIIGKHRQISYMMMAILAGGHILLEDLPGSGKTTLVRTLSAVLGCDYRRVQFTPDLMPSDITGMNIYDQKAGSFRFVEGPVATHILLADEINRAIPRTQAALLEAMEERQVTVDGESHALPSPFFVMATQNPVESESTFHLPAAQMDRFFVRLSLGYPTAGEEVQMLTALGDGTDYGILRRVASPELLLEAQKEQEGIFVSDYVKAYMVELVHRTRAHRLLKYGASPRASRSLYQGGKAWALLKGREYVTPEDVQEIALPILSHRILLTSEARFNGKVADEIIEEIIRECPVPPREGELFGGK